MTTTTGVANVVVVVVVIALFARSIIYEKENENESLYIRVYYMRICGDGGMKSVSLLCRVNTSIYIVIYMVKSLGRVVRLWSIKLCVPHRMIPSNNFSPRYFAILSGNMIRFLIY